MSLSEYLGVQEEDSIQHHGVKGMKWGVRKQERAFGTSSRIRAKRQHIEGKIKKSRFGGDKNVVMRNTINDYRRGRVAGLKVKEQHRRAKENYLYDKASGSSTTQSKAALSAARINRTKNVVRAFAPYVGITDRGTYNRHRNNGDEKTKAVLKTAGKIALTAAVSVGARKVVEKRIGQGLDEFVAGRFTR